MKWRNEYLSDEELKMLISEVENTDMFAAAPDMRENILSSVLGEAQYQEGQDHADIPAVEQSLDVWESDRLSVEHKRKEYRNYCFRVWTSVAAGIAMVFLLPKLMSLQPVQESQKNPEWTNTPSRQESVLADWEKSNWDKSVNDMRIFEELFSGSNIFGNEDKFNFFSERNGG